MATVYRILLLAFFPLASIGQSTKKTLVDGEGAPIVMLPGGTFDILSYTPHANVLSAKYKVIRMEHFNVQFADENRTLPIDYTVATESEAVGQTLDSLNIKTPVVLVGSSYGALIAFDFALNHPERIRALILFEPPLFWIANVKNETPPGMKQMQSLSASFSPTVIITEQDVKQFRCELLNCDSIDITKHPQWPTWLSQKNRLRGLVAINLYQTEINKLQTFKKPVLLINGSSTVAFHKRINELLASEFPHSIKKEVPGGHNAPVASSKDFIQALKDFIQ